MALQDCSCETHLTDIEQEKRELYEAALEVYQIASQAYYLLRNIEQTQGALEAKAEAITDADKQSREDAIGQYVYAMDGFRDNMASYKAFLLKQQVTDPNLMRSKLQQFQSAEWDHLDFHQPDPPPPPELTKAEGDYQFNAWKVSNWSDRVEFYLFVTHKPPGKNDKI